jgi:toxin FitB
MIVLDTNVLSELMRSAPDAAVIAWMAGRPRDEICTTSVNKAEILFGIGLLPEGRRRAKLAAVADAMFGKEFAGRMLPFDASAAVHYADIVVT